MVSLTTASRSAIYIFPMTETLRVNQKNIGRDEAKFLPLFNLILCCPREPEMRNDKRKASKKPNALKTKKYRENNGTAAHRESPRHTKRWLPCTGRQPVSHCGSSAEDLEINEVKMTLMGFQGH